jgi:enediyne polyketide synthase
MRSTEGIALVGMACRYPDARTPGELWENVLARRRAFRRIPAERLRLEDYLPGDPGDPGNPGNPGGHQLADSIYCSRAAVLEGWEFDRVRFRVAGRAFRAADLTHWLALEVAAEALAAAGAGDDFELPREATGVLVGNSLTGEFSRAQLLRLRWPYVRRQVAAALAEEGWEGGAVEGLLARLEVSYKAPFPEPTEETLAGGLSNTIAGRIANHFDLHGGGYTVDGACASSLLAVAQACSALAAGDLDLALAGGVDLSLDPFELVGFARNGALASGEMRVFDVRSAGFLPGEGCGFVVLMRERDARASGRRIHAVLRGWGISSDGHGGISRPEANGQRLALGRAYRRAGFGIETVAFFEAHGTGTAVGDATELQALAGALREAGAPGGEEPAAIGSLKANLGHTKAAAGVAGLLKAVLAIEAQVLPPTTGCDQPHPLLTAPGSPLRKLDQGEPWPDGRPLHAAVSAMGFGGINAHVVLEGAAGVAASGRRAGGADASARAAADADAASARAGGTGGRRRGLAAREIALLASPQDCELLVLAAPDRPALAARVAALAALAPRLSLAELADLAAELHRRWAAACGGAEVRAAVVASSPEELAQRLARLGEWLAESGAEGNGKRAGGEGAGGEEGRGGGWGPGGSGGERADDEGPFRSWRFDARQGIFLGGGGEPPRVGLLFPGQGSPAHLGEAGRPFGGALRQRFGEALAGLYARFGVRPPAGDPPAGGLGPSADGELAGIDTAIAQPAIIAHSLAGIWMLERLGLAGEVALGHSLGELAALCWAGAYGEDEVIRLAAARGRAMAEAGLPGAMASLEAEPATVAELIGGSEVVIAAFNGPRRTVVSGETAAVAAVAERAAARGIAATRLRVSHPFHSPRVAPAAARLAAELAGGAAPRRLARPVASTVSGRLMSPASVDGAGEGGCGAGGGPDLAALLVEQVTSPVRFAEAMAVARPLADLWIEVGPGHALGELVREALAVETPAIEQTWRVEPARKAAKPGTLGEPSEQGTLARPARLGGSGDAGRGAGASPPLVLSLDSGGPSLLGLLELAGAAFAGGLAIDLSVLFAGRFTRPFDLERPLRFLANPCESAPLAPMAPLAAQTAAARGRAGGPTLSGWAATAPAARAVVLAASPAAGTREAALAGNGGAADRETALAAIAAAAAREAAVRSSTAAAVAAYADPQATPGAACRGLLRQLVARRAELPEDAVRDEHRLLSDLHLNSIAVGQLVVEACRQLGLAPPSSPTDYATATVGQVAEALAERARLAPAAQAAGAGEPASPAGVDTWVRPFVVAWVERPLASGDALSSDAATLLDAGNADSAPRAIAPARATAGATPGATALAAAAAGASPGETTPAEAAAGATHGGTTPAEAAAGASHGGTTPARSAPAAADGGRPGWRVIAPAGHPLVRRLETALSAALPAGGVALCLPADPDETHVGLLLDAARAVLASPFSGAIGTPPPLAAATHRPSLVVVQQGGGGGAFARTLHLESPAGATRVVDLPAPEAASWTAEQSVDRVVAEAVSAAVHGGYGECRYEASGRRSVPVLRHLPLAALDEVHAPAGLTAPDRADRTRFDTGSAAALPLGRDDVLLVSGGGKGIGAECALDLARTSGARLALLGRAAPGEDAGLAANLERMAAAGVTALYLQADVTDPAAVRCAVERAEAELGPVTALLHAAGHNHPRRLLDLDEASFHATLAPKLAGARHLLAALDPARLRLLIAFGSIIARTGLPGEADYAVANEWLVRLCERHARRHPACRCLLLDWSVWSGVGMGERLGTLESLAAAGITPIPPGTGVEMLRRLLAHPPTETALVVTGRFGEPPTLTLERPELPLLRFLEKPRVYYPGIELVAESEISADTDAYLADHVFRGEPLFAAVLGLEAMAQAAMALTGATSPPDFEEVELRRPVAVPPGRSTTLRVAALVRHPGRVEVVLRDASTAFAADHFRAVCRFPGKTEAAIQEDGAPRPADAMPELRATMPELRVTMPERYAAMPALRAAMPEPGAPALESGVSVPEPHTLALGPATDLYGSLLFHRGRFHRIRAYRELRATACLAEISPSAGDGAWFGRYLPQDLLLGDPAARDAAIHAIQGCLPHATLLPTGVERIRTRRLPAAEPLLVSARERRRQGDTFVYDMAILDQAGRVIESWEGLTLRAVDRIAAPGVWPAPLLAPYVERRIEELLPGSGVHVLIEGAAGNGRPDSAPTVARLFGREMPALRHRPDGRPDAPADCQLSLAHAGNLVLAVTRPGRVGCDFEAVATRSREIWRGLLGGERWALADLIARECGDTADEAATRVWAAGEALRKAEAAAATPLSLEASPGDGWVLLRSGNWVVATLVQAVRELGDRCALAVACSGDRAASEETAPPEPAAAETPAPVTPVQGAHLDPALSAL